MKLLKVSSRIDKVSSPFSMKWIEMKFIVECLNWSLFLLRNKSRSIVLWYFNLRWGNFDYTNAFVLTIFNERGFSANLCSNAITTLYHEARTGEEEKVFSFNAQSIIVEELMMIWRDSFSSTFPQTRWKFYFLRFSPHNVHRFNVVFLLLEQNSEESRLEELKGKWFSSTKTSSIESVESGRVAKEAESGRWDSRRINN